ncbi:MAG: hypothetical protein J5915_03920 [Acidaminococcaceae bacterium]|nr:hypothetical protein [Acidaminococcaceae bacterium]MBQ5343865.1 hypothetical protein [Acidaminococcaceae bacterium]
MMDEKERLEMLTEVEKRIKRLQEKSKIFLTLAVVITGINLCMHILFK